MLLALRNDKGTIAGGAMYTQAAGGASLAELMMRGRVAASTSGRSTYAEVIDPGPVGDPRLDECLGRLRDARRRRRKLHTWVQRFAGINLDRAMLREHPAAMMVVLMPVIVAR